MAPPALDLAFIIDTTGSMGDEFRYLQTFQAALAAQSGYGSGDYEEQMNVGLRAGNALSWRQGNVARVGFIVADAPPHYQDNGAFLEEVEVTRKRGVHLYPINASGGDDHAEYVMRAAAHLTLGACSSSPTIPGSATTTRPRTSPASRCST